MPMPSIAHGPRGLFFIGLLATACGKRELPPEPQPAPVASNPDMAGAPAQPTPPASASASASASDDVKQAPVPATKGALGALEVAWGTAIGGLATQAPRAIATAPDGTTYVAGYFEGATTFAPNNSLVALGASDGFVAKFSAAGEIRWVVALATPGEDAINAIVLGPAGEVYVGGNVGGTGTFGGLAVGSNGSDDALVAAISPAGKLQWVTTFGSKDSDGINALAWVGPRLIAGGSFRGIMAAGGQTLRPVRSTDAFLVGLSPAGAILETIAFGDRGEESVMALATHPGGGLAVLFRFSETLVLGTTKLMSAGTETTDLAVTLLDPALSPVWALALGNEFNNIPGGLAVLPGGDLVVSGSFDYKLTLGNQAFAAKGASDVFVARISARGGLLWAQACGGPGEDIIYGTAANAAGEIAVTGWFEREMTCGQDLTARGGKDVFFARLAQTGEILTLARFGDEDHDQGRAIAASKAGHWALAGVFRISLQIGKYSLNQAPTVAPPRRADGFVLVTQTP